MHDQLAVESRKHSCPGGPLQPAYYSPQLHDTAQHIRPPTLKGGQMQTSLFSSTCRGLAYCASPEQASVYLNLISEELKFQAS